MMEVALLDATTLVLAAATLKTPTLVAGCPVGPGLLSVSEGGFISFGPNGQIEPYDCEVGSTCFLFSLVTR